MSDIEMKGTSSKTSNYQTLYPITAHLPLLKFINKNKKAYNFQFFLHIISTYIDFLSRSTPPTAHIRYGWRHTGKTREKNHVCVRKIGRDVCGFVYGFPCELSEQDKALLSLTLFFHSSAFFR